MAYQMINVGFGNMVAVGRIVAVVNPDSSPIKRLSQQARDEGRLVDATFGRRTRSVIICDSNHLVLCALQPETVAQRLDVRDNRSADVGL